MNPPTSPAPAPLHACKACGSTLLSRNGHHREKGKVPNQRYICRACGSSRRETYIRCAETHRQLHVGDPSVESKNMNVKNQTNQSLVDNNNNRSNNSIPSALDLDSQPCLIEYHLHMKRDGYKDATIEMSHKILSLLKRRGASLADSESVKQVISLQTWGGNRRRNVINAYTQYLKYYGYSWTEPKNTVIRKIPFIPSEDEIDQIIAASSNALACFLQLLKETAMRAGEALALRWIDVDCERRVICCNNPEKNSNSRSFPNISIKLLTMLGNLPHTSEYVFYNRTFYSLKNQLMRARRKTSEKLANPRLKEIHFHTLRHWKATMLYHYTKDLIYVQTFLGYRSIENTMLYIQLDKALFAGMKDDTFVVRAVSSVEEAIALGEVGFEPYLLFDGVQLMRKRK